MNNIIEPNGKKQMKMTLTLSAIELSRRLHSREMKATELLQITLDRIDEVNPNIHAIVALEKGMNSYLTTNVELASNFSDFCRVSLSSDRQKLFREAQDADIELDAAFLNVGTNNDKPGWLKGIPLCIKDLEDARGLPTTLGGCPLLGKHMPDVQRIDDSGDIHSFDTGWIFQNAKEDAPYVQRLRNAGGKKHIGTTCFFCRFCVST
jgi:Asp-tRNA(Asn)/Glu-tRNA(Gln) amidotransferase A subunit family amidase